MAAMLVVKTVTIISTNLHENGVLIPEERKVFFLGHQLGRRDVTCKPVIDTLQWGIGVFRPATRHQVSTQHQFKYRAAPFTFYPNTDLVILFLYHLFVSSSVALSRNTSKGKKKKRTWPAKNIIGSIPRDYCLTFHWWGNVIDSPSRVL